MHTPYAVDSRNASSATATRTLLVAAAVFSIAAGSCQAGTFGSPAAAALVPDASTWALLGAGLGSLLVFRRRR